MSEKILFIQTIWFHVELCVSKIDLNLLLPAILSINLISKNSHPSQGGDLGWFESKKIYSFSNLRLLHFSKIKLKTPSMFSYTSLFGILNIEYSQSFKSLSLFLSF